MNNLKIILCGNDHFDMIKKLSHISNYKKGKGFFLIPFFVSQNLEAELSKKCDELRQLFLLQQQSNNNNNHGGGNGSGEDEVGDAASSSPLPFPLL